MNSRQRLDATLSHQQPDRVCVDFGSTFITGRERIEIFNDGGGFVFNAIHNVQGNVPMDNAQAMFKAVGDSQ